MLKGGQKKGGSQRRNELGIAILAKNIRKFRKAKGLTIEMLANQINVDYSQISRMERSIGNPTVSIIFDIAGTLGIPADELLKISDE